MFRLFKSKPLLSAADVEFQIATYQWLLKHFGGDNFYHRTELVLPTREYFPSTLESAEEVAIETFERVKHYAGLSDWACRLQAQEADIDTHVAPTLAVQNVPTNPLGTFALQDDNEVVITYNPALTTQPIQLVATLAHELSHYLTATAPEEPPGGWQNWEFVTDIAATFLGFGIFMANSAFNFSQYSSADTVGWRSSRSGYLSEAEHIYALAIFLKLQKRPMDEAARFLKPNLKKLLKKALVEINNSAIVDKLGVVD